MQNMRSKRNLIIEPSFQYWFIGYSLFIGIAICSIFTVSILAVMNRFQSLAEQIPEFSLDGGTNFLESQNQYLVIMCSLTFVMVAASVFVISTIFSHQIAGPINKLKDYLEEFRKGGNPPLPKFRKNDLIKETADAIVLAISKTQ